MATRTACRANPSAVAEVACPRGVLLTATAHAHGWRVFCNGRRQGVATGTSAQCHAIAASWNHIGVICRDLQGAVRGPGAADGLSPHTDFEGTCRNMRGITNCGCEPEAVLGEQ